MGSLVIDISRFVWLCFNFCFKDFVMKFSCVIIPTFFMAKELRLEKRECYCSFKPLGVYELPYFIERFK